MDTALPQQFLKSPTYFINSMTNVSPSHPDCPPYKSVPPVRAGSAIELLEFQVDPLSREDFLAIDQEIWTTALSQYPAFQQKEIWLDPARPQIVTIVIYWADRAAWKAIPMKLLTDLTQQFDKKFSRPYQLVGEREYINH